MEFRKLAALAAVLAFGTACANNTGTTTDDTTTPTVTVTPTETDDEGTGEEHDVAVIDNEFDPEELEIAVGDTVVWTWEDTQAPHNVVDFNEPSAGSSTEAVIDSGEATAEAGTEYSVTFDEAGEYPYYCEVHGEEMSGTITVSEDDDTDTETDTDSDTSTDSDSDTSTDDGH
jgi:plastocyanin